MADVSAISHEASAIFRAGVAQLVEQLIRNQQVIGSSPIAGSRNHSTIHALSLVGHVSATSA